MTIFKKIIFAVAFLVLIFWAFCFYLLKNIPDVEVKNFGVTFSKPQAEALGLDWKKVYQSIFTDLNIKKVRIPVYWPEVAAPQGGGWNFSSIDWMLQVAEQYDAEIVLAVGRKLPRWPECHEPDWSWDNQNLLNYIEATIERYDNKKVVWAWQIENEPFLNFGECDNYDKYFLDEEISLVRSLSNKPIIVTDGGEFGDWLRAYKRADIFGSTLYRTIYNEWIGRFTYPIPPSFFRLKKGLVEFIYGKKPSIVIELQAEPWGPKLIYETGIVVHYMSMNPEKFEKTLEYIKGAGFDTFYLWGVEWWYWLKEKENAPEMWELAKQAIDKL